MIYKSTRLVKYNFSNVSKVATAFQKIWKLSIKYETKKNYKTKFLSKLADSQWLSLVDNMIKRSIWVYKAFTTLNKYETRSENILVYC